MDSNAYADTYQNYAAETYPTLNLHSKFNETENENSQNLGVKFISSSSVSYRHMSTNSAGSSDTPSSSNNLVMAEQLGESSPLKETHSDPFAMPSCLRHIGGLQIIITSMIVFSISVTIALIVQIYVGPPQVIPHGGIVSSSGPCSKLGFDLLKSEKASSVDAAVLTALCICITHPHAAGIGGGGFALVHDQKIVEKATHSYDFREKSPGAFSNESYRKTLFEGKTKSEISKVLAVAVPGVIKGLMKLHHDRGKLPWSQIVTQASNIAQSGIIVSKSLADAIQSANLSALSSDLVSLLLNSNNSKKKKGDIIQQPQLAQLLQLVANDGTNTFYNGNFSQELASQISSSNGVLTEDDMRSYQANSNYDVNETLYSDVKIITSGPPSSGFALHSVMSTMSEYGVPDSTDTAQFFQIHRLIEAIKYSLGFLTNFGDVSKSNYTEPFFYTNQSLGKWIKEKINDSTSYPPDHYLQDYQPLRLIDSNQQYLALIGPDAIAVVITLSIGSPFGSGIISSGVVMNDAMLDFSWVGRDESSFNLPPSQTNYLNGNVRPMSPMIPALVIPAVTKCGVYILPVVSFTDLSLSAMAQTLIYHRHFHSLDKSINLPRFNQKLSSVYLQMENDTNIDLRNFLRSRNHNISLVPDNSLGSVSAVQWLKNIVDVYTDGRDADLRDTALVF